MSDQVKITETTISNENKTPTQQQQQNPIVYDILNKAYEHEQKFNNYFQTRKQGQSFLPSKKPSSSLDSLALYFETIEPKPINQLPFKLESTEELYNTSPLEFISYINSLNLDDFQKRKMIEGWLENRIFQVIGLKIEDISFTDKKIYRLKKTNQLISILREIQDLGLEEWDSFYRLGENLSKAKNLEDLSSFESTLEALKPSLARNEENQKKIYQRLKELAQRKRKSFEKKSKEKKESNKELVEEEKKQMIKEFSDNLNQAFSYLEWAYNLKSKKIPKFAQQFLKILEKYRNIDLTPTPDTFRLAQLFWILRLNRKIDFSDFPPDVSSKIEGFFKVILDESLLSESAGFWLEKNMNIPALQLAFQEVQNNPSSSALAHIVESITASIRNFPNWQDKNIIRINVNLNDERVYKLIIDLSNNTSIEDQIKEQINSWLYLPNNPDDKFNLKQEAYQYKPIDQKSETFQNAFAHKEKAKIGPIDIPFFEKTEPDDFAIRINLNPQENPSSSPFSLFMVEHHQALLNFDIYQSGLKISAKFAHRHFDGIPAKKFFKSFIENLKQKYHQSEELSIDALEETDYQGSFPLFEAYAKKSYSEIMTEAIGEFNPTLIYALAIAIENNIDHFHFLVNGPDIFSKYGPYSNVQPALIFISPIKDVIKKIKENQPIKEEDKIKIQEWANQTFQEIQRAKKGMSAPSVISAPAGTHQKTLAEISKHLHPGTLSLIQSQGMFSAIPELSIGKNTEGIVFYTAKSDSYHQPINLQNPALSIGVCGFNQSQAKTPVLQTEIIFTVRKNPSQAQKELRTWFDESFGENKSLLKKFNELIKNWDKLTQRKITLKQYLNSLRIFFNSLSQEKKSELEIDSPEKVQQILNQILFESARKTIGSIENRISTVEKIISLIND
ncbi:MAG: hypothetical protein N2593_00125 [Patescibacteria group bacterium]|nr:hypothetical protein [Patescibacteria group bacterium]